MICWSIICFVNMHIWFNFIGRCPSWQIQKAHPHAKEEWNSKQFAYQQITEEWISTNVASGKGDAPRHWELDPISSQCWHPGRVKQPKPEAHVSAHSGLVSDTGVSWALELVEAQEGKHLSVFCPRALLPREGAGPVPAYGRQGLCTHLWVWANLLVLMVLLSSSLDTLPIYTKRN